MLTEDDHMHANKELTFSRDELAVTLGALTKGMRLFLCCGQHSVNQIDWAVLIMLSHSGNSPTSL